MGSSQELKLRWDNYLKHYTCAFNKLRTNENLADVTLSCEGKKIRAHKVILSTYSTYFRDLLKENPCQDSVIIFCNVKFDDLAALVDCMYQGEVNVVQEQLSSLLATAEFLAVQDLGTLRRCTPMPYHAVELQPEIPPNKRRKIEESTNLDAKKNSAGINAKDCDGKTSKNRPIIRRITPTNIILHLKTK